METGAPSTATATAVDNGASLRGLASDLIAFARAWRELLEAEFALAARSLRAIALAALCMPLLLAGIWLSLLALALGVLHELGLSWLAAGALDCLLQVIAAWTLLLAMRRWSRDLTPHRARDMLASLLSVKP